MSRTASNSSPGVLFSPQTVLWWRLAQIAVWLTGFIIVLALLFFPDLGVQLMWNVLIPVAPLLLVLGAGVWRNICPLATTALMPRQLGFSSKKKMSPKLHASLGMAGIAALYLIVPLRHAYFNTHGPGTAFFLIAVSTLAFCMGSRFEWKSGWCNGLCPVHPVEKLYSSKVGVKVPNTHCGSCMKCVTPCPESTPGIHPLSVRKMQCQRIGGYLMVGGFPGFVWGWFQVPDQVEWAGWSALPGMYLFPFGGAICTLALFLVLERLVPEKQGTRLIGAFAAAAVSCYYWFRIPALLGFGRFGSDGMLIDLRNFIPAWSVTTAAALMVLFFFYWLVWRKSGKTSWTIRPEYGV